MKEQLILEQTLQQNNIGRETGISQETRRDIYNLNQHRESLAVQREQTQESQRILQNTNEAWLAAHPIGDRARDIYEEMQREASTPHESRRVSDIPTQKQTAAA